MQKTQIIKLPFVEYSQQGFEILYCPALDLKGLGKSKQEAENHFNMVLDEYFNNLCNHSNKLKNDLGLLGWNVDYRRNDALKAPTLSDSFNVNKHFKKIFAKYALSIHHRMVSLSFFHLNTEPQRPRKHQ